MTAYVKHSASKSRQHLKGTLGSQIYQHHYKHNAPLNLYMTIRPYTFYPDSIAAIRSPHICSCSAIAVVFAMSTGLLPSLKERKRIISKALKQLKVRAALSGTVKRLISAVSNFRGSMTMT